MLAVLAHAIGDGQFPVPLWAIGYGTAALLVLVALAVRTGWPTPRFPWPPGPGGDTHGDEAGGHPEGTGAGDGGPGAGTRPRRSALGTGVAVAAGAVGVACWAVTLLAAFVGDNDPASASVTSITYYATLYGLVLGGSALSLVHGDAWASINPFATVARIVLGRAVPERTARPMPAWTAPAMIAVIGWLIVAFRPPLLPRVFGLWLAGHTVATVAGTALWGRAWLREGEGFAVLFAQLGRLAPLHRDADGRLRLRPPLAGTWRSPEGTDAGQATLVVFLAVALFDAVREFDWWVRDVVGFRSPTGRAVVHTVGFAFTAVVVAFVWAGAVRLADRALPGRRPWGGPLAAVAASFLVSRYTSLCLRDGWNLVALLSDPLGRGWDLFGTTTWLPPIATADDAWVSWVEVLALVVGGVAAVVLAHDASLAAAGGKRRRAAAAVLPVHGALIALVVGGIGLLLGA